MIWHIDENCFKDWSQSIENLPHLCWVCTRAPEGVYWQDTVDWKVEVALEPLLRALVGLSQTYALSFAKKINETLRSMRWSQLQQTTKLEDLIILAVYKTLYGPRHEKTWLWCMGTTMMQTSLRICPVWSAPLIFSIQWWIQDFWKGCSYV